MIYEFCAENVTLLEKAMQAGARRIELCDNLAVGGTTPSYGVTKAAVELAANYDTTIMTMIRPRGGDFVYNDLEIAIMLEDICLTAQAGSQGVVFGALTADKKLDKPNLEKLIAASKGMEIVFHMAFDELSDEDQPEAIDWLSQAGVTRILTRAGVSGDSLEKRFVHYHRILEYAKGNPNFKLKLATQKKFTWRLVVQAFFRVVVNPIFDKSYFFRSRFLGSFR
ncbi:copper homeostasis protein [Streptococcus pneumoniae]|nr:copper homeostasis protein [Streptococcus pneumoniae]